MAYDYNYTSSYCYYRSLILFPNEYWSHFKRCLKEIATIIPVPRIFERFVRPLFVMRSHPRWSDKRWKAKT